MGIPRPPHPRGDETSCLHLIHGLIEWGSPLASPTCPGKESIRRRRASWIVANIRLASRRLEVDESWHMRPGIGLETESAFFPNCSDASPLGLDCKVRDCIRPHMEFSMGLGSPDRISASSLSIIPGHISRPAGYITKPEAAPGPLGLSSARIVASRNDQQQAAGWALGSGTLGIVLSASTQVPHAKLMHLQDGGHTQRPATPPRVTNLHTHTHTHTQPPPFPVPPPKHLFALLSPLLTQVLASLSLAVLPDSPVDLVVWHTNGQEKKQASMAALQNPHPRDIAPRCPAS